MEIRDIERGLFQMAKLTPHEAESGFPKLSERLQKLGTMTPHFPNSPHNARQVFDLMRDLREEFTAPELVEEMGRLIVLEPARA